MEPRRQVKLTKEPASHDQRGRAGVAARKVAVAAMAGLAALCLLSGCAQVLTPLGSNKYDCNRKEDPNSPYCRSFKAVERGTNGAMPPSRFDETLHLEEHDRLTGIAPIDSSPARAEPAGPTRVTPTTPSMRFTSAAPAVVPPLDPSAETSLLANLQGRPVRQGPLVQRVWVKRFADNNDMLVATTYVYKEILPTRWSGISTGASPESAGRSDARATFPHRAPTAPAQAVAGPRCSGAKADGTTGTLCQSGVAEAPPVVPQAQLSELDAPMDTRQPGAMPR